MFFRIREIQEKDLESWILMRKALWLEESPKELAEEATPMLSKTVLNPIFVAEDNEGHLIAFLEGGLRAYAEGCITSPVAYIEGIYVKPEWQKKGIGKALVESFENWAKAKNLKEMASDAVLNNINSQNFHQKIGFEKVENIVTFRKEIKEH